MHASHTNQAACTEGCIQMKTLSTLFFLAAGITLAGSAMAQSPASTDKPVKKTATKKLFSKEPAAEQVNAQQPSVEGLTPVAFNCELGNKLTIYRKSVDDQEMTLLWNKRLHTLTRVTTTTGAHRFENKEGLVWIGIPAKSILLDAKKGQQLANECKTVEQLAQTPPAAQ